MTQPRNFVIRDNGVKNLVINAINNLPMLDNVVFEVVIRVFKQKRSNDQNALYWVRVTEISKQAWFGSRQFDEDTIHEHLKRELLPEVTVKGVEKWMILPTGERVLRMSTGDLNTAEFSDYFIKVEAFAAELGVKMSDSRFYR